METTDLMIGDYILHNGELARITSLSKDINMFKNGVSEEGKSGVHKVECANAIQLTVGFMEKNFPTMDDGITWEPLDEELGKFLLGINIDGCIRENCSHKYYGIVEYVHQVQHALRMCEIDKEVVVK